MLRITQNPSIREQVLKQMRELIVSNAIPSGNRLYEEKLAAELGVSRTPVREALHMLEGEGLLESIPRVGYVVKIPSIEDFEEIIEIRKALESLTAIWAAHKLDEKTMTELNNNLNESAEVIEEGEIDKFMELNEEFHEMIDRASGKKRICEINRTMRDYVYFYRIREILNKKLARNSLKDHKRILEAMKNRDEDTINKEIAKHLEGIKRNVLSSSLFSEEGFNK